MFLGISSSLEHTTPQEWAAKHSALGLKSVVFPVDYLAGEETIEAYRSKAAEAGLTIAEVGVWRNTLAADRAERDKWMEYAIGQLKMADRIGARCCVNVVGTPYGPRWDGGYKGNFSNELWQMAVQMIRDIIDNAKHITRSLPLNQCRGSFRAAPMNTSDSWTMLTATSLASISML